MTPDSPLSRSGWRAPAPAARLLLNAARRPWLALGALLALQALISAPRLKRPFIEGRAHWNNDSASFLLRAVHSDDAAIATRWDVFGLKEYAYGPDGRPARAGFYAHHPVLNSALFKAWTSVCGYADWAPRSYSLALGLAGTAFLFFIALEASGGLLAAFLIALLAVCLPLPFNYQDAWKHESLTTLCSLGLVWLAQRRPRASGAVPVILFFLVQSGWAGHLLAAFFVAWLFLKRRTPAYAGLFLASSAAVVFSVMVNAALLAGMGFGPHEMRHQAAFRSIGPTPVTWASWASRQWDFLGMNFGWMNTAGMGAVAAASAAGLAGGAAGAGGAALLAVGVLWPSLFRSLAQSHHYAQWYLAPGYALTLAALYPRARQAAQNLQPRWRRLPVLGLTALIAGALPAAAALEHLIHDGNFARGEDMRALAAEPGRVLAAESGASGPRDWWVSPNVLLYTDPIYKAKWQKRPTGRPLGGFGFVESVDALDATRDIFVALDEPWAITQLGKLARRRFGARLRVVARSPTFVYMSAEGPAPGALVQSPDGKAEAH